MSHETTGNTENFFDPLWIRESLTTGALYITAYEMLKDSILSRVRSLYVDGFDETGEILSPEYNKRVLSKCDNHLKASLLWLKEAGAIDQQDHQKIDEVRKLRDEIAHGFPDLLVQAQFDKGKVLANLSSVVELLKKIETWWILNVELATDPDWDSEAAPIHDGILPGSVAVLSMLRQIALGDDLMPYVAEFVRLKKQV